MFAGWTPDSGAGLSNVLTLMMDQTYYLQAQFIPLPTPLILNATAVINTLDSTSDVDWYQFTVSQEGPYTIESLPGTLTNASMTLYGPNSPRTYVESVLYSLNNMPRISRSLAPGTYYVCMQAYPYPNNSSTGTYFFRVFIPPVITSLAINNGAVLTTNRTVTLNNTCTGNPTQYQASESPEFSGAAWLSYSASPSFTLSAKGSQTVYFKVKNVIGESVVMSDSIYVDLGEVPGTGMVMIPAGSFTMGDALGDAINSDEKPLHSVQISAFYLETNLVTKALWDEVYGWAVLQGYSFDNPGSGKAANHPVQMVNWYDMVKWCNARSQRAGLTPVYYTDAAMTQVYKFGQSAPYAKWVARGYRLPTEAEWEYAARGRLTGKRFPWGDTITQSQANYYSSWSGGKPAYAYDLNPTEGYHSSYQSGGTPYTSPVGSFAANGYGLYDMAGNVYEWCWDWYGSYSSSSQTDPRGPASGSYRVIRGGGWGSLAINCRVARRDYFYWPDNEGSYVGFRSVLPPGQ
jgi:formylglycine-generating enzyme